MEFGRSGMVYITTLILNLHGVSLLMVILRLSLYVIMKWSVGPIIWTYAASIFRVNVGKVIEFSCIRIYTFSRITSSFRS
jgi:hypothetical protein